VEIQSPQFNKMMTGGNGVSASGQSAMEEEDMLYEYFPLSLEDW